MRKRLLKVNFAFLFSTFIFNQGIANQGSINAKPLWTVIKAELKDFPLPSSASFQVFQLNTALLAEKLQPANSANKKTSQQAISLPMPDGGEMEFSLEASSVMHPHLAARYPEIRTYKGKCLSNPNITARFDMGPSGFHAMIIDNGKSIFIQSLSSNNEYISFNKKDLLRNNAMTCLMDVEADTDLSFLNSLKSPARISAGPISLKVYRLALAATCEYTAARGGTIAKALSSMVTTMNRVNGIYEKELGITMELIPNTDTLIYKGLSSSDPYTNNNGGTMLAENQENIDNIIGTLNYDIGHVFSTGGGGIANLQAPCSSSKKAMGVTGSPSPAGDAFDVDYVAHEIGHQFGANHTFNSNVGSCQGNKNAGTAFEPGSGSTIMAYAGICTGEDLQAHSDAYFHNVSFNEIYDFITVGNGRTCPAELTTSNNSPVVTASGFYNIPFKTPFMLTGSAIDPDGDAMTYCWEQIDAGPSGSPKAPTGNAPTFRSFVPSTNPTRTFPRLNSILNRTSLLGEVLPTYARTLHFRLTARDNNIMEEAGGVGSNINPVIVNVLDTETPFKLTVFEKDSIAWGRGTTATVTWDVSSTNEPPIQCSSVNILFSKDGGLTFPIVLASNVPNNGLAEVEVPDTLMSNARLKVEAVGNIFFSISDYKFSIAEEATVGIVNKNNASGKLEVYPNPSEANFNILWNSSFKGEAIISVKDLLGRTIKTYPINKNTVDYLLEISLEDQPQGVYLMQLISTDENRARKIVKK